MPQNIVITGASSGLGLAFLNHYISQPTTDKIIAIDLDVPPAEYRCQPKFENTSFINANVCNEDNVNALVSQRLPPTMQINLLIHCAGIRGLVGSVVAQNPGDVAAAETYKVMDRSTFVSTFDINTYGAFNVISAFLPRLRLQPNTKVVVLSSRMGSVASNVSGGAYAYRASKAALNAVVKSFSVDVPDVAFLMLHPGRVETGLVGWREDGAISVDESLRDCLAVIEGLGKEGSGRFVDRFGVEIPW
ncbi:hypothetical protein GQ44DRAFT_760712 [Phaeosphaeriaceae sp. PMI808]|nr:hypothetical protein GQ44DRAFT_760712 [Phaeosphaeriaceae sp. PMI808]